MNYEISELLVSKNYGITVAIESLIDHRIVQFNHLKYDKWLSQVMTDIMIKIHAGKVLEKESLEPGCFHYFIQWNLKKF